MAFIANWVTDKASEYAKMGLQAGGSMAGNAVGGVGSMVENAGRNAGGSVTGGIGGVGGYINNYGESIKRSMSSDGPVSGGGQKKTAVKPSSAVGSGQKAVGGAQQKALPAAGGANKALSSAGGAARGVGSSAQKTASSATRGGAPAAPKPSSTAPPSKPSGPSANTRSATSGPKPVGGGYKTPANNANGGAANPRMGQQTNKVQNRATDGKAKVSAASRPGAMKTASKPPVKGGLDPKKHDAKDPLAMGGLGVGGKK